MAVIYVVSYTSMYEELYNEVKMFSSKEEAIKHCNSIVEDINNELDEKDRKTNVFDDYLYGYKKYVAVKPYTGVEWLLTLNEVNTPFEIDEDDETNEECNFHITSDYTEIITLQHNYNKELYCKYEIQCDIEML